MRANCADSRIKSDMTKLLASTTGAMILLCFGGDAKAQNECSAQFFTTLVCTGESYPNGITYDASGDLALRLENPQMVVTGDISLTTSAPTGSIRFDGRQFDTVSGALNVTTDNGRATINVETGTLNGGIAVQTLGYGAMDFILGGDMVSGAIIANEGQSQAGGTVNFLMTGGTISAPSTAVWITNDGSTTATINENSGPTTIKGGFVLESTFQQTFHLESGSLDFAAFTSDTAATITLSGGSIVPDHEAGSGVSPYAVRVPIFSTAQYQVDLEGTDIRLDHDYWSGITFVDEVLSSDVATGTFNMTSGVIHGDGDNATAFHFMGDYVSTGVAMNIAMSGGLIDMRGDDSTAFRLSKTPQAQYDLDISGGIVRTKNAPAILIADEGTGTESYPAMNLNVTIGSDASISVADRSPMLVNGNDDANTIVTVTTLGQVYGSSMLGGGDSDFVIGGGTYTGDIYGDYNQIDGAPADTLNQGNDRFTWTKGQFIGSFYGQGGSDQVLLNLDALQGGSENYFFDGGEANDGSATDQDFDQFMIGAVTGRRIDASKIVNFEYMTVTQSSLEFFGSLLLDPAPNYPEQSGILVISDSKILYSTGTSAETAVTIGSNIGLEQSSLRVNGLGSLTITGIVISTDSDLDMQDGSSGGEITILGDYEGINATGAIDINVADGTNDTIIIEGSVSGTTELRYRNVASNSSPGQPYGFAVVEAPADSPSDGFFGTFTDGMVQYQTVFLQPAGYAPGYFLLPTDSAMSADRFLDRDYVERASIDELIDAGLTLQPFVPLYEAYQSVMLEMMELPSMRTRSGGRYADGEALSSGPALDALWGRLDGGYEHFDPQSSTASYDYDLSRFEMQAGLDGLFADTAEGALIGGFTAHYQTGEARIASRYGDSSIHPDGYGFGGTLTWFGANGFYADAQAEFTWFTSELKADDLPLAPEDSDAFGYALSMEVGQAFGLGDGMALTPQAQLSFADIAIDSFTGAYADHVSFSDGQSLLARAGLAIEKESSWQDVNGEARAATLYGIANLYYEFLGETTAQLVNLYDFTTNPDDFSGELGFGGSLDWQAGKLSYSAFAELTASTGFDTGSYGYGGNVGLKVRW